MQKPDNDKQTKFYLEWEIDREEKDMRGRLIKNYNREIMLEVEDEGVKKYYYIQAMDEGTQEIELEISTIFEIAPNWGSINEGD